MKNSKNFFALQKRDLKKNRSNFGGYEIDIPSRSFNYSHSGKS